MVDSSFREKVEALLKANDFRGAVRELRGVLNDKDFPLRFALAEGTPDLLRAVLNEGVGVLSLENNFIHLWDSREDYQPEKLRLMIEYGLKVEKIRSINYDLFFFLPKTRKADELWDILAPRLLQIEESLPQDWREILLIGAAYHHQSKLLEKLYQQGFKLNGYFRDYSSNPLERTLLHEVARGFGRMAQGILPDEKLKAIKHAFEVLAISGLTGEEEDSLGRTPLHYLCLYQAPVEVIDLYFQVFFNKKTELSFRDRWEDAPLFQALNAEYLAVNKRDQDGNTPLHYACQGYDADLVKFLVKKGSNPNAKNAKGETPLFYVDPIATHMFVAMLDLGADPRVKNSQGRSLVMEILERPKFDLTHPQVASSGIRSLLLLLERGASAEGKTSSGNTFLTAIIRPVIVAQKDGLRPIEREDYPKDAFYALIKEGIKRGANLNEPESGGYYPIYFAVASPWLTRVVLELGANPNVKCGQEGRTPIQRAVALGKEGFPSLVLLLESEADPNLQENDGSTALHLACRMRKREIAQLLVKFGAKPWQRNSQGNVPGDGFVQVDGGYKREKVPLWALQLGILPLNNEDAFFDVLTNGIKAGTVVAGVKKFLQGILKEEPLTAMLFLPKLTVLPLENSLLEFLRDTLRKEVGNTDIETRVPLGVEPN